MMDATIKAKWVAALRSGEYEQGTGQLKQFDNRYCCLGVLRHLLEGEFEANSDEIFYTAGVAQGLDVRSLDGEQNVLADMNDGAGQFINRPHTFSQIADYIEQHL
jgi:predicted LPLAT superfamily acyltransferase